MSKLFARSLAILVVAAIASGCSALTRARAAEVSHGSTPTDGETLALVAAAVHAESRLALVGREHATRDDVKDLAAELAEDHAIAGERAREVSDTTKVAPIETDEARSMSARVAQRAAGVAGASAVDEAYLDEEIALHDLVLQDLDGRLIGAARSARIAALLRDLRAREASHLARLRDTREAVLRANAERAASTALTFDDADAASLEESVSASIDEALGAAAE